MGSRRKARELALQMLFQYDMSGNTPEMIIATFEDLQGFLQNANPDQKAELTILRGNQEQSITVTLAEHP